MKHFFSLFAVALVLALVACEEATPTIPAGTPPPEASAAFQKILADCWGVAQMKEIDAQKPAHIQAFDCARERLLQVSKDYPNFADSHRVLGWGYYYKNRDVNLARAEYQRAADIYRTQGKKPEEADMYRRLGLLYMEATEGGTAVNTARGCELLRQALALDPQNPLTIQQARSFLCIETATPPPFPTFLFPTPNASLPAFAATPAPNPSLRAPVPTITLTPTRKP